MNDDPAAEKSYVSRYAVTLSSYTISKVKAEVIPRP